MSQKYSLTDRFSLRPDLVVEEVDDEVIVLDLEGNQYFGLNGVAWLIWQGIADEKLSLGEIVDAVTSRFEISEEQARGDAEAFICELIEAGLARHQNGGTEAGE